MLIHFPVALWPAHFGLHLFAAQLPANVSAIGGFWLLAAGTILGWMAACFGLFDLVGLARDPGSDQFRDGLVHSIVNGTALAGFTVLAATEYPRYPAIHHHAGFLLVEAALLVAMFTGNYFGGAIVWRGFRAAKT
jgi:uncharacterized membrane protein